MLGLAAGARPSAGFLLVQALMPWAARAQAPAARSPFDGAWAVTLTCPVAADGALGYVFHFPAQVADGVLHGENAVKGAASWLTLDGPIQPDGSAALFASGLTGPPEYNVGRVQKLIPYNYHVSAHFGAASGAGTRMETRPCTLQFTKL